MKLLNSILVSSATAAWEKPTYKQVMDIVARQSDETWGYPTGKVASLWSDCPELPLPAGGLELACDQSTCALVCQPGHIATGKRRTRCRYSEDQGHYWKHELDACETCPDLPAPEGVYETSSVDYKNKKQIVKFCAYDEYLALANGVSMPKVTLKCECPRSPGSSTRTCDWYSNKMGGKVTDLSGLSCTDAPPICEECGFCRGCASSQKPFKTRTKNIKEGLKYCNSYDNGLARFNNERIVAGVDAKQNSWPFIVNIDIHTARKDNNEYYTDMLCGGSIIDNYWILTAAHCLYGLWDGDVELEATKVTLNFGQGSIKDKTEQDEFKIESTKWYKHDKYPTEQGNMDWALIKIESDVLSDALYDKKSVAIACLPKADPDHGEACWVAGWGALKSNAENVEDFPDKLKSTGVNIFSQEYCKANTCYDSDPKCFKLQDDDICAGIPDGALGGALNQQTDGGTDSCQGDSGGPLICDIGGKATLVGVVSRGDFGCASPNSAGLYSSTFQAQEWIVDTISKHSDQ